MKSCSFMKEPSILQVVGFSQTGKTTFLLNLIKKLSIIGVKCATIKSARMHSYIPSTKDSDLLLESGSEASIVVFSNLVQFSLKNQMDIHKVIKKIKALSEPEIILLEGFKELRFPKIVILTEETMSLNKINLEGARYILCPIDNKENIRKELLSLNYEDKIEIFCNTGDLIERIILDFVNRGK